MKKLSVKGTLCILSTLIAAVMLLAFAFSGIKDPIATVHDDIAKARLVSDEESDRISIIEGTRTKFALIYSATDEFHEDAELANTIHEQLRLLGVTNARVRSDAITPEIGEFEILFGNTDRPISQDLLAEMQSGIVNEDDVAYAYAYVDGKLAFTASCAEGFDLGSIVLLSYLEENDYTIDVDLYEVNVMTRAEYDAAVEANKDAARYKRMLAAIAANKQFTQADFGGAPLEMPSGVYDAPHFYPAKDQHPRMFVANADLEMIYNILISDPLMKPSYDKLMADANTEGYTGIFPEKVGSSGEVYRYSSALLGQMEARAFLYLLTGDECYGYEAIVGAKNAMISLHYTTDLHMDVYHGASHVMVNVAKVYDWCYDLLTEDDKNQIIAGVSNILAPQMESGMRFPPSGMSSIVGHGTGPQFIRDWMTVAIIFYDEMPSWWDYVGGRFYQEYVPVINAITANGYAPDGTTTYGDSKYLTRSWAAWLVKTTTGEYPYTEDFNECAYYFFSHIQPNGKYFQTGDGARSSVGATIGDSCAYMMITAMMFQDETIAAMAKYYTEDYTRFSYAFTLELTAADMAIFYALGPTVNEEHAQNLDTIQYFAPPGATMVARTSWDDDAAAVLMRVGTKTLTGHNLYDHGTFQIYYKGLLAGTSGVYKKYGGYVHQYYLQMTVAHNGLLIFDPEFADDEPIFGKNEDGTDNVFEIKNHARYFYSGSQVRRGNINGLDDFNSTEYTMASMLGADKGYNPDGTPKYAYIGADFTNAYDSRTVDFVSRKMLTVFTGNEELPLYFFVYDQIDSTKDEQRKSFLLHTVEEPTLIGDDKAVITTGEGRLVLEKLSSDGVIEAIGGRVEAELGPDESEHFWKTSRSFWINGKNCYDGYITDLHYDLMWGRIEISDTGKKETALFNAMYVTDIENDTILDIESYKNESVEYAKVDRTIAAFINTKDALQYKEFSFDVEGTGLYEYYLVGLEAGTWQIKVDGVSVASVYSDDGAGFASFVAPAGEISVIPGIDVIGANGGKIKYSLGGGTFEGDYPLVYKSDETTTLPTNITKPESTFLGWYLTPTFDEGMEITEVPMGMSGTFSVYARWLNNILNLNYDNSDKLVNCSDGKSHTIEGIGYNCNKSEGGSFITKTDDENVKYLEWIKGSSNPIIGRSDTTTNYATMTSDDECASFTVTISKNKDEPPMASIFRIYTKKTPTSGESSDTISRQVIFSTNANGEVRLGDSVNGPLVTVLTEEKTTIRIVLDFKNEKLIAYNDYGEISAEVKVSPKAVSGCETMSEWRKLVDKHILYWIAGDSAPESSLRIYSVRIDEGHRFHDLKPSDGMIVYDLGGGGAFTSAAPVWYNKTEPTELPIPAPLAGYTFGGWYTSPDFEDGTAIAEIPAGMTGIVRVYARWTKTILDEKYVSNKIVVLSGEKSAGGISYRTNDGVGASFITAKDKDGTPYLEWCEGTDSDNPFIVASGNQIANLTSNTASFELTFSKNGDAPLPTFYMRTYTKYNVAGETLSPSNSIYLFLVKNDGIYLPNNADAEAGYIKIADITDGKMTIKVVLDFKNLKLHAYTDEGVVTTDIAIPESSGATTGIEYQSTFNHNIFYMMTTSPESIADASMKLYGITVTDGNAFLKTDTLDGNILYFTNGGKLPENAPTKCDPDKAITLPELTVEGSEFLGWYTTPNFLPGTEITEVPANAKGLVMVYAKWQKNVFSEDYTDDEFTIEESKSGSHDGVNYNTGSEKEPKPGSTFTTVTDPESGNTYIKGTAAENNAILYVNGAGYNLTNFTNTAISYEISIKKEKGESLATLSLRLTTTGGNYGGFNFLGVDGNTGEIKLVGSDKVVGTVTEEFTKLRITIDFHTGTYSIYDEQGVALDTVGFNVPKAKAGYNQPLTHEAWQKVATNYLLYAMINNPAEGESSSFCFDDIKIIDGRPFAAEVSEEKPTGTAIFITNGGSISGSDYADISADTDLILPIPTKAGHRLVSWYTTPTFDEGTEITLIKAGTEGIVKLYAKYEPRGISYEVNDGILPEDAHYDFVEGDVTPLVTPTKTGHKFLGWYTTATFDEGTLITEIPAGASGHYVLYAKFVPWGISYEVNDGILPEDAHYDFVEGDVTPLVTPTRDKYNFMGWYTTATFDEGTLITEIPAGASGYYKLYAKWERTGINYGLNGGTLPGDANYDFIEGAPTPLPTPTKKGYTFGGWYTSPDFEYGTAITEIPEGTTGVYWVYAKWCAIYQDFSGLDEGFTYYPQKANQPLPDGSGITIGSPNCNDSSFALCKDENGNRYLLINRGSSGPRVYESSGKIARFSNATVRYELVVAKEKDENGEFLPFMGFFFRILAKKDVNGANLSPYNYIYMFKADDDGAFLTNNVTAKESYPTTNKFADFDENGVLRITLELDFENLTLTGFGTVNGEETQVTTSFTVPESSGAADGVAYMKTFTSYTFFIEGFSTASGSDSVLRLYSIAVYDKPSVAPKASEQ